VKSNDDSKAKQKAISCRLSDYFGFNLSENGSVLSIENDCCITCHLIKPSHITDLTLNLPLATCT